MNRSICDKRGFTVIELTIVMALVAVFSAMVIVFSTMMSDHSEDLANEYQFIEDCNLVDNTFYKWIAEYDTPEHKFLVGRDTLIITNLSDEPVAMFSFRGDTIRLGDKMLVDTLSFASASTVTAATVLNPKLKNASYLFLDIKDIYSHFSFVVDGKVIGYYSLPFGLEFLRSPQVISEDMLFDHSYAELTVLNAKERAQSQTLSTMPTFENVLSDTAAGSEEGGNVSAEQNDSDELSIQKIFFNKTPRNLPKFMRRDVPDTEDAIAYENFRIFVKWALSLIQNNEKITIIRKPEFVCVNLPSNLAYVLDMANAESKENGIMFTRLSVPDDDPIIASSLELYGGLFPSQINPGNKF